MTALTVKYPNGRSVEFIPRAEPPPTLPPGLYRKTLRIFDVQGYAGNDTDQWGVCRTKNQGNCSGVEGWYMLGGPEIALIRRVNPDQNADWTTEVKMHWCVWDHVGGVMYAPEREESPIWKAQNLLWGSKSALPGEYNLVKVLREENGYSDVERIRKAANYDGLSPSTHPWLFHRVWCTNQAGRTYDTPKGKVILPLFDMRDFDHATGDITGNWARNAYLGAAVT